MNTQKFTIKLQELLANSQQFAIEYKNQSIEVSHFILSIIEDANNMGFQLLKKVGVNITILREKVKENIDKMPKQTNVNHGEYLSRPFQNTLNVSINSLSKYKDTYLTPEILLLNILESKDEISTILKENGADLNQCLKALEEIRNGNSITDENTNDTYDALDKYAINLNQMAEEGKLDPVIGRDEEIRRVLHILSRKTKNNPMLIGEPGVGKTAIAEGIAKRIINKDVPNNLLDVIIYALDMGALIAGAKYKGEFEERLKTIVKEVVKSNGKIVLFIDEIHTLIGAGKSEGAMDAANILKPSLARGDLRSIGATTLDEYQKYFEKDKAMERRFQKIIIDEPSIEDAISIMRGLKDRYERYHNVKIKDEAIIASVVLSQRYISDRFLPDKAIDLIDEAAAKLRLEINSLPEELDEMNRKIMQLEIEKEAILREKDTQKLNLLENQLINLIAERDLFKSKWEEEKKIVDDIQIDKTKIESLNHEAEQAERNGNYARVAELRYGEIVNIEKTILSNEDKLKHIQQKQSFLSDEVTSENIAEIVSKWTNIPLQNMLQSEKDKLINLEEVLKQRVVGQNEAIEVVSNAILRSRAGLQNPNRPIGSFLFLGSTGVGKTELAKALAEFLFNDENAYIRIDMSEYQEKHSVSRLVGAPPGYVGYDESGQLTEAVRRNPYSVVLFDEIEKAHPDTFNILLQMLDDGRLTDNKGRLVNFKNTIIIMTSNFGSDIIINEFEGLNQNQMIQKSDAVQIQVLNYLKTQVKPEFINRIDDIVLFLPLLLDDIKKILKIQLNNLSKILNENELTIELNDYALNSLADNGFDPEYGARPLKRHIQKQIVNPIAKKIISGEFNKGDNLFIDFIDNEIVIYKKNK